MIDGEVEVLEFDELPQQRSDRFAARTGFDSRALAPVPLVAHLPAPHPGLLRLSSLHDLRGSAMICTVISAGLKRCACPERVSGPAPRARL